MIKWSYIYYYNCRNQTNCNHHSFNEKTFLLLVVTTSPLFWVYMIAFFVFYFLLRVMKFDSTDTTNGMELKN